MPTTATEALHSQQKQEQVTSMPGFVVDTQEALKQREALEPGEYHVVLTNHKVRPAASADKYPSLMMEMTIAEDEEEYAGRKVFRNLSAAPQSLWAAVDAAVGFGADIEEVTGPEVDFDEVFTQLRGNEAWVVTSQRMFQRNSNDPGTMQTNVDRIMPEPSAS
jgi:hypothetical protein